MVTEYGTSIFWKPSRVVLFAQKLGCKVKGLGCVTGQRLFEDIVIFNLVVQSISNSKMRVRSFINLTTLEMKLTMYLLNDTKREAN